ncbi:MAG: YfhO family protein [Firmicutes bacterium]|nr:YfhO family protein [Bacillota bacterium]MCM1401015.1 YfhO family protein [Bacteroides sp.]MCM1476934.1 YfhO family protein [Bacteroides sp.]
MNRILEFLKSKKFWSIAGSVVAMALIAVVYFYPDDVVGNTLSQHDMEQGSAIGHEARQWAEQTGHTPRWTNSLFGGMPTFQISPSYPSNSLFNWINRAMGLWLPNPADWLMMMMLGFFILLLCLRCRWYVALIGAVAYGFSSYFIIIIGAGHIWKFITLAYIPPTIAGMVLCYRGRYLAGGALAALMAMMQISANHPQMTYYFLFVVLGMAVAYLITAVKQKKIKQWGIATGVLAVAAVLAVGANLPSLYNTYEYSKETMRGGHSELTPLPGEQRNATAAGLDRDYITQYSYETSESFSLLIPNIKGGATSQFVGGGGKFLGLADLPEAQEMVSKGVLDPSEASYLGYISQYFGGPEGTSGPVYVGALIVALFLLGCVVVKGPMKWVLILLTLFSILLALGRNCMWLTNFMIDHMPMYSKFRTVESILVIAEFTMPLLGALALQKVLEVKPAEAWERYGRKVMACFGVVLVVCLAGIVAPSMFGSAVTAADKDTDVRFAQTIMADAEQNGYDPSQALQVFTTENPRIYHAIEQLRYSMVQSDSLRSFIIVALGLGLLLLYFRGKLSVPVVVTCVGIVICGDLFMVNKRYLNSASFVPRQYVVTERFAPTPADKVVLTDTAMNYRVLNIPQFSSAAPSYHHKTIGGYHAAKLTRYQDLIDRQIMKNNPAVLNMLNTRYIIGNEGAAPELNPDAMGNAWFVDRIDYVEGPDAEMSALDSLNVATTAVADKKFSNALGASKPKTAGDTIFETTYAPDRLTYHARSARGGVAVFSEVFFPWGWQATIDGRPAEIGRVNYLLRAINIPAGEHTVEMVFDPQSLHSTTNVAYVSIIIIYLGVAAAIAVPVLRRRKEEQGADNAKKKEEGAER